MVHPFILLPLNLSERVQVSDRRWRKMFNNEVIWCWELVRQWREIYNQLLIVTSPGVLRMAGILYIDAQNAKLLDSIRKRTMAGIVWWQTCLQLISAPKNQTKSILTNDRRAWYFTFTSSSCSFECFRPWVPGLPSIPMNIPLCIFLTRKIYGWPTVHKLGMASKAWRHCKIIVWFSRRSQKHLRI